MSLHGTKPHLFCYTRWDNRYKSKHTRLSAARLHTEYKQHLAASARYGQWPRREAWSCGACSGGSSYLGRRRKVAIPRIAVRQRIGAVLRLRPRPRPIQLGLRTTTASIRDGLALH